MDDYYVQTITDKRAREQAVWEVIDAHREVIADLKVKLKQADAMLAAREENGDE